MISNKNIDYLINKFNLGSKIMSINKVSGGLLHKMYRVETDKAIYAVKELNPVIMKRADAYSNFVFSEKVTDIAIKNGVCAIGSGGNYALSAARALIRNTQMSAREIAVESMKVASEICVFTNGNLTVQEV